MAASAMWSIFLVADAGSARLSLCIFHWLRDKREEMVELGSRRANKIASITLSLKMSETLTTTRTVSRGPRRCFPPRVVFT